MRNFPLSEKIFDLSLSLLFHPFSVSQPSVSHKDLLHLGCDACARSFFFFFCHCEHICRSVIDRVHTLNIASIGLHFLHILYLQKKKKKKEKTKEIEQREVSLTKHDKVQTTRTIKYRQFYLPVGIWRRRYLTVGFAWQKLHKHVQ